MSGFTKTEKSAERGQEEEFEGETKRWYKRILKQSKDSREEKRNGGGDNKCDIQ